MKRTKKLDKLAIEIFAKQKISRMISETENLSQLTIAEIIKQLKAMAVDAPEVPTWFHRLDTSSRFSPPTIVGASETYPQDIQDLLETHVARQAIEKLKRETEA